MTVTVTVTKERWRLLTDATRGVVRVGLLVCARVPGGQSVRRVVVRGPEERDGRAVVWLERCVGEFGLGDVVAVRLDAMGRVSKVKRAWPEGGE